MKFPFIGEEPEELKTGRNVAWKRGSEDSEGRLIIYIIGGISHYEICALQNLEKSLGASGIIIGSDQILTPRSFIKNLSSS